MSLQDRIDWDATYRARPPAAGDGPPRSFAPHAGAFPVAGTALDVACGQGQASVWLAKRGLQVWGVDVSPVAVEQAAALAAREAVADRCRFDVVELDEGLPPGPSADVVLCNRFRDRRLDGALVERLAPGGVLAICVLSEVGGPVGRFRAAPGELATAFAGLTVIAADEGAGEAWLLARK
ncbi:class I SAM-dependent methyltransferase [Mycobacterium sp. 21AC1]|uniref:class I SAM-dependent methyltransferase n=1 Tax=[Mycobacterium] appelbergii TaxID=2939269 RepID=UPI002938F238|nr:class I SAM-dependent methyltransferase [Mycobacterium sp. 21AC1]MDV3128286.1 class I SAM-dependent methyltransferase [Mycobacterium sp. 21AC1]